MMLFAVRVVLVAVAALVGLAAPSGAGAGAVDTPYHDERVTGALDLLAAHPETAELRPVLDANRVGVQFTPMAPGLYARYSVQRRIIEIDSRWAEAEPETLAAVLAHEATHAQDAVNGYLASGGATACIDSEVRAFRTSARFWLATFGPDGKPAVTSDLERQLNLIAQRQAFDPASLDSVVRQTYTGQCAH
jgi:hypothetical protein